MQKTGFQIYLRQCLAQKQQARPGYSLRAFARDLAVSPSELSLILNGRRNPSLQTVERVLAVTRAPDALLEELRAEWSEQRCQRLRKKQRTSGMTPKLEIALGQMAVYGSSYTLTLLEALRLKRYRGRKISRSLIREVAGSIGIPETEAVASIELLRRCGFLPKDGKNGEAPVKGVVLYAGGVPNASIRSYHQHLLSRCQASIDERPVEERINDAIQMPISRAKLNEIRQEIRNFHAQLIQKYAQAEEGDDVLLLSAAGTLTHSAKQENKR